MIEVMEQRQLNIDKSDWQKTKLLELAEEISERSDSPGQSKYERFVGLEHFVSGDLKIKNSSSTKDLGSSMKVFKSGDVLFARRNAYLRRASLVEFDGICSGDAFVLRENHEIIVPGFLAFVLNSHALWDFANSNAAGTMSKRVKWRDLGEYEFLLPPKDQQARLAELLWAADEMINQESLLLERLISSKLSFQNRFFNFRNLEESGIMEIASVQRGRFSPRPRNDPKYFGGNIPFIQTAEVIKSKVHIKEYSQTLNELGLAVSKLFPKGTIVMVIAGTYVGACGILDFDSAFTDSLLGIRADENRVDQKYLFYFMQFYEKGIDSLATEVAQRNLSIDLFQGFRVKYPKSLNEQREFVKKVDTFENVIELTENNLQNSKQIQKSLINQIF